MKDNIDNHIEKIVDKSMKKIALDSPSLDFTKNVMTQIDALEKSSITIYKPLISKPMWVAVFAVALMVVLYLLFGNSTSQTGWLNFIDLSVITDNRLSNALSSFTISKTLMYALVLFGVMFSIQVPLLKNYFDKQFEN